MGSIPAAHNLAEIALETLDFPEAERRFRSLVRVRPHDDTLLYRIFLCALLQNHPGEAEEISQRFSRVGPTPVWYYVHAALSRRANKNRQADDLLGQARILYPDKVKYYDATFESLGLLEPISPPAEK